MANQKTHKANDSYNVPMSKLMVARLFKRFCKLPVDRNALDEVMKA